MIHPREIDVWTARLDASATTVAQYEQLLSADEIRRANAFRFSHLRTSFIAGRGTLRRLVGRYTALQPHEIQFGYTDRGKPFLPKSELRFNLSHSGEYVVYVFAVGAEVGIDIEQIRPMDDLLGIARRFFAQPEVHAIEQAPLHDRSNLFFQIWTLKESFIKATGEGLARPLDGFAVQAGPEPSIQLIGIPEGASDWRLQSFMPAPGYIGGVAVQGPTTLMRWNTFEHETANAGK